MASSLFVEAIRNELLVKSTSYMLCRRVFFPFMALKNKRPSALAGVPAYLVLFICTMIATLLFPLRNHFGLKLNAKMILFK